MKRTRASSQFWLWFERNSDRYLHLTQVRTKKEFVFWFDELQTHAMAYCKLLAVDFCLPQHSKGQLVITCHGKTMGFKKAEQLVRLAPALKNWEIIALRQPKSVVDLKDWTGPKVDIGLSSIWFQVYKQVVEGIHPIRVYVDYILPGKEWDVREHAMMFIEQLVGEKVAVMNIDLLEVDSRCNASKRQRLRPLAELPEYIAEQARGIKVMPDGRLSIEGDD
ncbi:MAG TPA: hypothetical protein VGM63_19330 [Mucilaginibacter sp.]|jgi:hypothetical protein